MIRRMLATAAVLVALLMPCMAQAPSPDALTTARELIATSRAAENVKLLLPSMAQHMKPAVVQGRPQVEKDYDAIVPLLLESFSARMGELVEQIAVIYATTFTVAEMKELIAFYRGPTGQKFLAKAPAVAQQSMAAGQQFGARIGRELQSRIIEELQKKGHKI